MAQKKSKVARIITPKGIASFPWLTKPDRKFTNAQGLGHYKLDLVFDSVDVPGVADLIASLTSIRDAAFEEAKNEGTCNGKTVSPKVIPKLQKADILHEEFDAESQSYTGRVFLRFKQVESITFFDKKLKEERTVDMKPTLVDAKGDEITKDIIVRGGSVVKVAFRPSAYCMATTGQVGLSLRPEAVQIVELAEGGNRDFGFGEEEGYEYSEQDDAIEPDDTALPPADEDTQSGDF